MGFKIQFKPISVIKAQLGIEPDGRVQKAFTHTCRLHMDKYVPMRDGDLAINNVIEKGNKVIYNSPYAHYMYIGKVMGPNIPKKDANGNIVGYFSPKGKPKYYTGKDIVYNPEKHPLATSYWDIKMWTAEKDVIIAEMQDYIKKGR
jgi:hypothetical protein